MMTFDMQAIGRKISSLRKQKNMTQMDLADSMGISFQAVSNWERGLTMPDISKLPELAELFGVTVDEILGNKEAAKAVEALNEGKPLENADGKTIAEIAPIVKPEQLKETVKENKDKIDLSALIALAPFLDSDEIYEMVTELSKSGAVSIKDFAGLAPFMDSDDIGKIAEKAVSGESSIADLAVLAPFMDEDDIGKIALRLAEKDDGSVGEIAALAPFMDEDDIGKIAKKLAEGGKDSIAQIVALAPFMDGDDLKNIVKTLIKKGNADSEIIQKIIECM